MGVTFVDKGSIASSASTASLNVTAPMVQAGDTLFCAAFRFGNTNTFTLSGWTALANQAHGGSRSFGLFWKKASAADSGATFALTTAAAQETHAIIFAMRTQAPDNPIDPAAVTLRTSSAVGDAINMVTNFDAVGATVHEMVLAIYYDDQTDFSTVPTGDGGGFILRFDAETSVGNGCTFALCSRDGDGGIFAPGNWASNSVTDNHYVGMTFALNGLVESSDPAVLVDVAGPVPLQEPTVGAGVLTDAAGPLGGSSSQGGTGVLTDAAGPW